MSTPDDQLLIAADLARLISPGLRSPRTRLAALPYLPAVNTGRGPGISEADAIEALVNRGLDAMAAGPAGEQPRQPKSADPVRALRAALALRPGSERVKSKTRRSAAAQAMGLLSGDGWRAHHEKALLGDLAAVVCGLDSSGTAGLAGPQPAAALAGGQPGIDRFYNDFVDIRDGWESLFAASSTLDLAIMYGATWRNTYRKHLGTLAARPGGRLRIVLPSPSGSSPLATLYAHALGISADDFRRKVSEAIDDFRSIGPPRHVEIYLTTAIFRHAIYLFSHQAILALYALCGERLPSPALLLSDGGMLAFMRQDFDRLLEQSDRISDSSERQEPWNWSGSPSR